MFEGTPSFAQAWQRVHHRRPAARPRRHGSLLPWWTDHASQARSSRAFLARGGACLGGITRVRFHLIGGITTPTAVGVHGHRRWIQSMSLGSTVGALRFISTEHGLLISIRSKRGEMFRRLRSMGPGQNCLPMPRFFCRWRASTANGAITLSCFQCTGFTLPRKPRASLRIWWARSLGCMPPLSLKRHPTPNEDGTSG